MAIDVLELQLASALQRFAALRRRVSSDPNNIKLLHRSMEELEASLETVRLAQQQLAEGRQRLEAAQAELIRERERYWQLFDQMPQAYVVTESNSVITEVNRAAAQLFNVSQRFLVGKPMSVFIGEDRTGFLAEIGSLTGDQAARELAFRLRPRERAPVDVVARVSADATGLRWVLRPAAPDSATR